LLGGNNIKSNGGDVNVAEYYSMTPPKPKKKSKRFQVTTPDEAMAIYNGL
jgi:hypothetical protein